jgi:roadblock/LC7 domain-containing protein
MQARGWEASSGNKGYYPVNGFTLIGMEWSAITDGNLGVVINNQDADYEAAYETLGELGGAG